MFDQIEDPVSFKFTWMQKPCEIQQNASLIVRSLSDLLTWYKHWGPRWSSRSCSRWGWRGGWTRGSRAPSPGSSGRCLPLQNHYQSLNSKCGSNQCRVVHRGDQLCHLFHTLFLDSPYLRLKWIIHWSSPWDGPRWVPVWGDARISNKNLIWFPCFCKFEN